MRVLYVNHTSHVSGGERSLLTLLRGLPADVEPSVACPSGELADAVRAIGCDAHPIPGTDASLSLHPVATPRAIASMARTSRGVRALAGTLGTDLIHANSIRAGLITSIAPRGRVPPTLVHMRDCLPRGRLSHASLRMIDRSAAAIVANSGYTRMTLGPARGRARVVHNAVDIGRLDRARTSGRRMRDQLDIEEDATVLAVVAQITPWKAQDDAIRIAAGLAERHEGLRLLIVGSPKFWSAATRYDNMSYARSLEAMVTERELGGVVSFLGERSDVPEILSAADVLLVPSWEEPFGRVVVEGMAMGVPVAATSVGGPAEILTDGCEGLLLEPRRPELWIDALDTLLADPRRLRAMGERGRSKARLRYGVSRHVEAILEVYAAALTTASRRR
jgi:glycosyltransferase involved in cell wall biosynthesis